MRRRKSTVSSVLSEIEDGVAQIVTKVANIEVNKESAQDELRELSRAVTDLEKTVISRGGYEVE